MHPEFRSVIDNLDPLFQELCSMLPKSALEIPNKNKFSGVYLFSEGDNHLYVGRSRNIRNRYSLHCRPGATQNQASFAFQLAREATGRLDASYRQDGDSRTGLMADPEFSEAFSQAKGRIRAMEFRFVQEQCPIRQALLEIYCAVALKTPYNKFETT